MVMIVYPSDMAAPILAASNNKFPTSLIPLERTGTAEEMAGATLFLTSMAGGYCNGNVLITDGGRLSMMPSTY
jgi:NAD(P)-dependent dehydrogenase (short-subunit alcohol dehydrogenase family)